MNEAAGEACATKGSRAPPSTEQTRVPQSVTVQALFRTRDVKASSEPVGQSAHAADDATWSLPDSGVCCSLEQAPVPWRRWSAEPRPVNPSPKMHHTFGTLPCNLHCSNSTAQTHFAQTPTSPRTHDMTRDPQHHPEPITSPRTLTAPSALTPSLRTETVLQNPSVTQNP